MENGDRNSRPPAVDKDLRERRVPEAGTRRIPVYRSRGNVFGREGESQRLAASIAEWHRVNVGRCPRWKGLPGNR